MLTDGLDLFRGLGGVAVRGREGLEFADGGSPVASRRVEGAGGGADVGGLELLFGRLEHFTFEMSYC